MKNLWKLIIVLISINTFAQEKYVYVSKVIDGDTFVAQGLHYRIAEIDAPELKQVYGVTSQRYLSNLILYKTVRIVPIARDSYSRTIAKVWDGKKYIAAMMVSSGHAWWYSKYSNNVHLDFLQKQARVGKKGLWSKPNPQNPYQFRKANGYYDRRTFPYSGYRKSITTS